MNDLQTALIATMEAIVRLHSNDHDYLNDCDCPDALAFRQADATLTKSGIDYATEYATATERA